MTTEIAGVMLMDVCDHFGLEAARNVVRGKEAGDAAVLLPERVTGAWLNGLSLKERIEVLRGPFGQRMHRWAGNHVTFIRWARRGLFGTRIENGSIFFLQLNGRLLGITAAHVYRGYVAAKALDRRTICYVENIEFDAESRLVSIRDDIDIATFDFAYEDLATLGKQALTHLDHPWPPPHPFPGQAAYLAGFPGKSRLWIGTREISFGLYIAAPMIGGASDRQITFPYQRDAWIDVLGYGLPPRGFQLGGISGGPMLLPMEKDGVWDLHLGGVISEAHVTVDYETVVVAPAHFIGPEGEVLDERSAPIRHSIPASDG